MHRRFFPVSHDLLAYATPDGRFVEVNDAWTRLLGWCPDELTSRPYLEFVHPYDRDRTLAEADRLALGAPVVSFRNRYRASDGSYLWLDWRATLDAETGLVQAAARDVNEVVTLHERLAAREQLLTRLVRDQLQACEIEHRRIAHELHDSALQDCIGARLLLDQVVEADDERVSPELRPLLSRAHAQVEAAIDSTRRVMQGLDPFDVDALDLPGSLRALAGRVHASYGVPVDVDVHDGVEVAGPLAVDAYRAVQEAVVNAAKHGAPKRIRVDLDSDLRWVRLEIADDGTGFDPQDVQARANARGSGLGLALLRERIDSLDGSLDVRSSDSGTRVVVQLPRRG